MTSLALVGSPAVIGVVVALGIGLLVGLERERRKGEGADRAAAGLRTFAVAGLLGALASAAEQPGLVPVALLAVATLAAVSYWKSLARDPGLTTELALLATCLLGTLAVAQPVLAAAAGVLLAMVLAAREPLHRFATGLLSAAELRDLFGLAAVALVLLPLMPATPLSWLAGLQPRLLVGLVVLILLMQAAGHVALRVAGPRAGLALAGLFGGLVSSTATIASMGARHRAEPTLRAGCEAGAMLSTAATWLLAMLLLLAVSPVVALTVAPAAMAGLAVAAGSGWWQARRVPADAPRTETASAHGPLRLREAAVVAATLTAVSLVVSWTQAHFGTAGLLAATALGGVADAHASIAALGAMSAAGLVQPQTLVTGTLVAVATNALTRTAVAFVSGGPRFGAVVGTSLAASTTAAAAVAWAAA